MTRSVNTDSGSGDMVRVRGSRSRDDMLGVDLVAICERRLRNEDITCEPASVLR